jgi:hypothetical protein
MSVLSCAIVTEDGRAPFPATKCGMESHLRGVLRVVPKYSHCILEVTRRLWPRLVDNWCNFTVPKYLSRPDLSNQLDAGRVTCRRIPAVFLAELPLPANWSFGSLQVLPQALSRGLGFLQDPDRSRNRNQRYNSFTRNLIFIQLQHRSNTRSG